MIGEEMYHNLFVTNGHAYEDEQIKLCTGAL